MAQISQDISALGLPKARLVTVKQGELFHSQIQPQAASNYQPEVSLRSSMDPKTIKKSEILTNPVRMKNSSFLESRSVRPSDPLGKAPDFSDLDQRRAAQFYKRESELKDSKIRQMTIKANHLHNKLKLYVPEEEIGVDVPAIDDNEKKIKRLENLLRIKNEEVLFKIKIQAANLLAEFQVDKADVNGINYLDSENEIFEFLMSKLKAKLKEIKGRERETGEWRSKDKLEQERNEQTIHFLTETNEILKNSEARCKLKLEEIKQEWNVACEKVADRDRLIEDRDNEIFKLKKMYEDLQGQHLRISANERQLALALDNQKREAEAHIKELRSLLTTYNLEKKQLSSLLEEKDGIIEEMDIRDKFAQEEFEKVNREYVRWKERYEWLEKEKEGKMQSYQLELDKLVKQFEEYKAEFNIEELNKVKADFESIQKELAQERSLTEKYEDQIQYMNDNRIDLEEAYFKKVQTLQSEYLKKSQNFEAMKQKHIEQVVRMREEQETAKIQELDLKWRRKIEEQENYAKSKLAQVEQLNIEKLTEKDHENLSLQEQILTLQEKLAQKDKLITVLYPKTPQTPTS